MLKRCTVFSFLLFAGFFFLMSRESNASGSFSFCLAGTRCFPTFYFDGSDQSRYASVANARYCSGSECVTKWIKKSDLPAGTNGFCIKGICTRTPRHGEDFPSPNSGNIKILTVFAEKDRNQKDLYDVHITLQNYEGATAKVTEVNGRFNTGCARFSYEKWTCSAVKVAQSYALVIDATGSNGSNDKKSFSLPKPDDPQTLTDVIYKYNDEAGAFLNTAFIWRRYRFFTAEMPPGYTYYINEKLIGCSFEFRVCSYSGSDAGDWKKNLGTCDHRQDLGPKDCSWGPTISFSGSNKSDLDKLKDAINKEAEDFAVPETKEYNKSAQPVKNIKTGNLKVGDGYAETDLKRVAANRLMTASAVDGKLITKEAAFSSLSKSEIFGIIKYAADNKINFKKLSKEDAKEILKIAK